MHYTVTCPWKGDPLQVLSDAGTAFATYRYDAWGNAAGSSANGTASQSRFARLQLLRYAGYCYDADTKMVDPSGGRAAYIWKRPSTNRRGRKWGYREVSSVTTRGQ